MYVYIFIGGLHACICTIWPYSSSGMRSLAFIILWLHTPAHLHDDDAHNTHSHIRNVCAHHTAYTYTTHTLEAKHISPHRGVDLVLFCVFCICSSCTRTQQKKTRNIQTPLRTHAERTRIHIHTRVHAIAIPVRAEPESITCPFKRRHFSVYNPIRQCDVRDGCCVFQHMHTRLAGSFILCVFRMCTTHEHEGNGLKKEH